MTDQLDLDQIETRAAAASEGPWRLSDDYTDIHAADGEHLASYCHTTDGEFIAHARTDVPAMVAEIRRLRAELERRTEDAAFLERTTLPELRREIEHHKDGKQRWRDRAEKAEARVTELEAFAYGCDGEGCVLPHSSWCERAKKTAAENNGCTCGQPWTGHPQPHAMHCWTVNPPRSEIDQMRRALAAMRTKTLTTEADEIVLHCPDHSPQDQDGVWMDCHCAVADDMRRRAAVPAAAEETHVVADDSGDPEHVDDCPGCEAFTLTGHRTVRP